MGAIGSRWRESIDPLNSDYLYLYSRVSSGDQVSTDPDKPAMRLAIHDWAEEQRSELCH